MGDQLSEGTRQWLANPTKNIGNSGGVLKISHIFKWYRSDFEQADGSVHAFLRKYSNWSFDDNAPLDYIGYHWGLNGVNSSGQGFDASNALHGSRSAPGIVIVLSLIT